MDFRKEHVYHEAIFTDLSPNTERRDRRLSWRLTWRPWQWKRGVAVARCENWFRQHVGARYAWGVNSGRSGLYLILKALNITTGDEVLLQAFTCNAVPNPAIWMNAKVVYVDIDEDSLNMDPTDLEQKITDKSKVIIVQHTFGCPADMDRIMEIAKKYHLIIIEDCAHALGATYHGRNVGSMGVVAFFSFGRDKVISSVYGGMVTTNDTVLASAIDSAYSSYSYPSMLWIWQQLRHPRLMERVIRRYFGIGRYLLFTFQKLRLLSLAVQKDERRAIRPRFFPRRLPNALAMLALDQLERLRGFNLHRVRIAQLYRRALQGYFTHTQQKDAEEAIFLRYTMRSPHRDLILKEARKHRVMLGKWYLSPVAPEDTAFESVQYIPGSCPHAEKVASEAFNLPTNIRISETGARRVIRLLKVIAREIESGQCTFIPMSR